MATKKNKESKKPPSDKSIEGKKQKFIIRYGVGGGMNDTENFQVIDALSLKSADSEAYEKACETFHSYDYTNYGLDDDASEEEINEEMQTWIEWDAWEYTEEKYNEIIEKYGKQAIE